ncbi:hypothetical protein P7K49_030059, partial [Saguinus oedipus]
EGGRLRSRGGRRTFLPAQLPGAGFSAASHKQAASGLQDRWVRSAAASSWAFGACPDLATHRKTCPAPAMSRQLRAAAALLASLAGEWRGASR